MVVHKNAHGKTCDVYDMCTAYRQFDGTRKLYSTLLRARYRQLDGMSHLSLTCGCAHKTLIGKCVLCMTYRQLEGMRHISLTSGFPFWLQSRVSEATKEKSKGLLGNWSNPPWSVHLIWTVEVEMFKKVFNTNYLKNFNDVKYELKEKRQQDNRKPTILPDEGDLEERRSHLNKCVSEANKVKSTLTKTTCVQLRKVVLTRLTQLNAGNLPGCSSRTLKKGILVSTRHNFLQMMPRWWPNIPSHS